MLHGLAISPDLDTVTYTLADAIDPVRGWGLADESWRAMEALQRYATVRPETSAAAPTWFNLGDRDLATHFYRTARLDEGATLTEVTGEICAAWGIAQRIVPMSDQPVSTVVTLLDGGDVSFQEYFVRMRHGVPISAVRFDGADQAVLTPGLDEELRTAECIVVAPSNPIVSIAPIRALAGVDAMLRARRESVVAISPIVGGAALKGPADRMLSELGHEPSVVGVARLYASIAGSLVIDPVDAHLAPDVEASGHARRDHSVGDEQPRDRRGAGPCRPAQRLQPSDRRPTARSVHGAQARWMRARVGETANRTMSLGRRGALIGRGRAGARHHRPQVTDRCGHAGPDVDDQSASAGRGTDHRVDGVVDVQEVAGLTPITVDQRALAGAQRVSERADHPAVGALARSVDGAHRQRSELDGVVRPVQVEHVDHCLGDDPVEADRVPGVALLDRQVAQRHIAVQRCTR